MRVSIAALIVALLFPFQILAQQLTVARIIDGDTFELSDGRRVRL